MRKFGNSEFSTKPTNYYNLDVKAETEFEAYRKKEVAETQSDFDKFVKKLNPPKS